jgi:hypothetical protein
MRRLLFLILLISSLTSFGQKKIKRITSFSDKTVGHFFRLFKSSKPITYEYYTYNPSGKETEWVVFGEYYCPTKTTKNKDGSVEISRLTSIIYKNINFKDSNVYDSSGRLRKTITWYYHNNTERWLTRCKIYTYNSSGLPFQEIYYNDSNKIDERIAHFYKNELNNEMIIDSEFNSLYKASGLYIRKIFYQYDSLRRIVSEVDTSDGKFLYRNQFIYYADTNVSTELNYDKGGNVTFWLCTETKYIYKNNKLFSTEIRTSHTLLTPGIQDSTSNLERSIYQYDSEGILQRINHFAKHTFDKVEGLVDYGIYEYY